MPPSQDPPGLRSTPYVTHARAIDRHSIERYLDECKRLATRSETKDGEPFKMMPFECDSNGIHGKFQWTKVRSSASARPGPWMRVAWASSRVHR